MAQFNSEAIEPITKLVDSDAQTAVDTIKAVVKAGQEYNSFLDKSDDKAGRPIYFIIYLPKQQNLNLIIP